MPNWHLKIVGRSQIPATRAVIRQLVAPPKGGIKKIGFKAYRETHRRDRAQWGARCQPSVLRPRRHNDN